ncbi:hypothetical protein ACFY2Y_16125 [Janibacter hoylei]|jgi:hypothetical protein|uniref:hypothetical protein n=1 Tax=Janibacter hoylei TaxID=364298 RepID=UPI00367D7AA0
MTGGPPEHHQQPCLAWPDCSCGDGSVDCLMTAPHPAKGASPNGDGALDAEISENFPAGEGEPWTTLTPVPLPNYDSYVEFYDPGPPMFCLAIVEVSHG